MDKKFGLDDNSIPEVISLSDKEIELLLEAIYDKYGYDFRSYSRAHVKRRLLQRLRLSKLDSIYMLQQKVLHDSGFITQLLKDFSINVTEMFRDPDFYLAVREKVIPLLRTWSYIKI